MSILSVRQAVGHTLSLSKSNLIYFFQCRQCGDRYVGRTLQHLGARIRQHVPLSFVPLDARECRPHRGRPPKCAVQSIGGSSSSCEDVTACPSSSACVGQGQAENSVKDVKDRHVNHRN